MSLLPVSQFIGTLTIIEIYVEYNSPKLFSCRNEVGQTFLALWVDEEDDYDLWLYIAISIKKLNSIRQGHTDLHQAFLYPENKHIYEIKIPFSDKQDVKFQKIKSDLIDIDCLPLEETFIKIDSNDLETSYSTEIADMALEKSREIVYLSFKPSSNYPNELPSLKIGNILVNFQRFVSSIGKPNLTVRKKDALNTEEVNQRTEFNVFVAESGSFKLGLAASYTQEQEEQNIFDTSLAGNAVSDLIEIIKIKNNFKELKKKITSFTPKTLVRYKCFLENLIKSDSELKIDWASPNLNRGGGVIITLSEAKNILDVIKQIEAEKQIEHKVIGKLFKIDLHNWKFGIEDRYNEQIYKGDILETAQEEASIANMDQIYRATIIETTIISPIDSSKKSHYELVDLELYTTDEQLSLFKL